MGACIWNEFLESGISVAGSLVVVPEDLPECWTGAPVVLNFLLVDLLNLLESIRPGHLSRSLDTRVNDVLLVLPVEKLLGKFFYPCFKEFFLRADSSETFEAVCQFGSIVFPADLK